MENNTGLTNKEKAMSLYKWTLRKYLPFSIAYWILLFITFPMVEIFGMIVCVNTETIGGYDSGTSVWEYYKDGIEEVAEFLPGTFFAGVVVLFSAILAIMAFSYMHNKRSVDLFGSFPVSRRTLFFSRYFAVITACVVPIIVFGGLGTLLTLKGSAMILSLKSIGIILLEIIGNVSFVALISLCCGTVADVIISYGVINIVYPICVAICHFFPKTVIPGIPEGYMPNTIFTLLCPIGAPFVAVWGTGKTFHIVWWIVLAVVMIAGCYVLCKKRKAETAQNAFAFAIVEIVIKFATCFTAGFGAGWILSYLGSDVSKKAQYCWFVVGLFGGIMIANVLLHLIFHRGLSKYKKSLVECGAVFVTAMAFLLIVTTGAFGYDMRIPDVKDVKEVSVKIGDSNTFTVDGKDLLERYTADEKLINKTLELHQEITDVVATKKNGLYPITINPRAAYYSSYYGEEIITITYKLADGRTMKRCFDTSSDNLKIDKDLESMAIEDYWILETIPVKYLGGMDLEQYHGNGELSTTYVHIQEKNDRAKWKKVIKALCSDIEKYGPCPESYDDYAYNMYIYYHSDTYESVDCDIYIPETYVNTIKALEDIGYANVGYHAFKENYYEQVFESTKKLNLKEERTIYFKIPDGWDENTEVQCMPARMVKEDEDWEELYRLTNIDDEITKCEKVTDKIWKYTIRIPEVAAGEEDVYDYVMFYQIGKRETHVTDYYKMYEGEEHNMLKIKKGSDWVYLDYDESIVDGEHLWTSYKEETK